MVGRRVGGGVEGGAEGGEGAVARKDAHHQVAPRGKVHVHLGRSEEVLPWGGGRWRRGGGLGLHMEKQKHGHKVFVCRVTFLLGEDASLTSQFRLPFYDGVDESKLRNPR